MSLFLEATIVSINAEELTRLAETEGTTAAEVVRALASASEDGRGYVIVDAPRLREKRATMPAGVVRAIARIEDARETLQIERFVVPLASRRWSRADDPHDLLMACTRLKPIDRDESGNVSTFEIELAAAMEDAPRMIEPHVMSFRTVVAKAAVSLGFGRTEDALVDEGLNGIAARSMACAAAMSVSTNLLAAYGLKSRPMYLASQVALLRSLVGSIGTEEAQASMQKLLEVRAEILYTQGPSLPGEKDLHWRAGKLFPYSKGTITHPSDDEIDAAVGAAVTYAIQKRRLNAENDRLGLASRAQ